MQESVMLSPFFSSSFFSPHPTPACSRSFHLSVMGPLFVDLRIDNSCRGGIHVLQNILRTTIATKSCDISYERAYFSAYVGASFMVLKINLKKM